MVQQGGPRPPRGGGARPPAPPAGGGGKYLCPECPVELTSRADMINHLALHAAATAIPAPAGDPEAAEVRDLQRKLGRINGQLKVKGIAEISTSNDLIELESKVAEAEARLDAANQPAPNDPGRPPAAPHHEHSIIGSIWDAIDKGIDKGMKPFGRGNNEEGDHHG